MKTDDDIDDVWSEITREGPRARGQGAHGTNPTRTKPARRGGSTPHKRLVKAICRALRQAHPRCALEVRNVMLTKVGPRNNQRTVRLGQPGEADVRFHLDGVSVALEAKAGRDAQRDSQARWQARWEKSGGTYQIVRTVDDALTCVAQAMAARR